MHLKECAAESGGAEAACKTKGSVVEVQVRHAARKLVCVETFQAAGSIGRGARECRSQGGVQASGSSDPSVGNHGDYMEIDRLQVSALKHRKVLSLPNASRLQGDHKRPAA
eukprot:scaffold2087_cov26-Tisochrysis_lutea.AAC.2